MSRHCEACMQKHLFRHFSSAYQNGTLNDASVTLIDKTDSTNPPKRQDFWRKIFKTLPVH